MTNDKQRERLVELLEKADKKVQEYILENDHMDWIPKAKELAEVRADYLLKNGVIVPPIKLNGDLWWIDNDNVTIEKQEQAIKGIGYDADGKWYAIDYDRNFDEIGTRYAYASREDAEKAVKEGIKE